MKTRTFFGFRTALVIVVICLLVTAGAFPQQVIKLKNGKKYNAIIKSRSGDTLVYELLSKPDIEHRLLMAEVDTILSLKIPPGIHFPGYKQTKSIPLDTIPDERKKELYLHYRQIRNIGMGFLIGGAIVTGLGLGVLIPAATEIHIIGSTPEWADDQAIQGIILTGIGGLGLITGIVMTIKGSVEMKKYTPGHDKVSFDLKFSPGQTRVTLVYRF
jgi:hypothetical protein